MPLLGNRFLHNIFTWNEVLYFFQKILKAGTNKDEFLSRFGRWYLGKTSKLLPERTAYVEQQRKQKSHGGVLETLNQRPAIIQITSEFNENAFGFLNSSDAFWALEKT